ncbi:peptidase S8 and S53 [Pyrenochaeta sp. MPI-SDFR-AT-0127]|nr:peptidase S8 and S53 [Pyrenochaeta sp. MPI-SDFR-AT-0127]
MSLITINGNSFDPSAAIVLALGRNKENAKFTNYILLQTTGEPLRRGQKLELEKKGVKIHEYVSEDTYLCGYKPQDLETLRDLPYIKYANIYLHEFVVQPSLKAAADPSGNAMGLPATERTRITRDVDIVFQDDIKISRNLLDQVAHTAHADPDCLTSASRKNFRLVVQEQYLDDLAALDAVKYIQEVHPLKLCNNIAREILNVDTTVNGTKYKGEGEVVCVADTGFDSGDPEKCHDAFKGRVKALFSLGRLGKADDPEGHGTHVCGSVLGCGTHSSEGLIEAPASKAKLVVQSLLATNNELGGIPADLSELFQQGYDAGARIHTNSWEARIPPYSPQLPYDSNSAHIDEFVHKHSDMVILFAAGNYGVDDDNDGRVDSAVIGSYAAAKNCITVGATESLRPNIELGSEGKPPTWGELWPFSYPKPPIFNDHVADNKDGMAALSSRGPTKEQRFKPDVVAPGSSILSTRSSKMQRVSERWGRSSDPKWFYLGGTSMATPLVAGCCAIVREFLIKSQGIENPSAALVKAVLINGAAEVVGQYFPSETGVSPNNASGFGRVDMRTTVFDKGSKFHGCFQSTKSLDDEDEFGFDIPIPEKPRSYQSPMGATSYSLKITLVWSDPPGSMLQNDLDLIVKAGNTEFHGNLGSKSGFDRLNNVEQIVWDGIPHSVAKVIIKAHRITREPQHFSYAWRIY